MNEQTLDWVARAPATNRQTEGPMTRTAGRDLAAGLSRASTRRAALVGLLGLGLVMGGIPALANKDHKGHRDSVAVGKAKPGAGKAKKTGKATPEAGQVTAASEVTAAAGKFKTVKRTFSFDGVVGIDLVGPSKTYPASITVSGFKRARIKDINVRIPAFFHDFPQDVDLLLVGPQGQEALIFSDVGGATATPTPRDVTLDDEATQSLTANDALVNGTFKPTNVVGNDTDGVDLFPNPAPAIPRDLGSALSVFDGTNPNGEWQLFLVDDAANDGGLLLAPGWTLTITARVRR
jgi:subtilisin-like proprotein convertase family protein